MVSRVSRAYFCLQAACKASGSPALGNKQNPSSYAMDSSRNWLPSVDLPWPLLNFLQCRRSFPRRATARLTSYLTDSRQGASRSMPTRSCISSCSLDRIVLRHWQPRRMGGCSTQALRNITSKAHFSTIRRRPNRENLATHTLGYRSFAGDESSLM